jgi:ABC-2 type transport system ATP-binding protein
MNIESRQPPSPDSSSLAVSVTALSKSFRTFARREGIWGGVKDLFHREYKSLNAVEQISFGVPRGEIVGFIGPNGAGKSTTIKMLTGILKPSSGDMQCLGFHPYRDRKRYCSHIGVVFGQRTQLWWDIAVIESFNLLGNIYRVPLADYKRRLEQLTEILELGEFLHTPVRKLSLGQRLRSDLAASLLHGPELLFLDEPTIGVDAVAKTSIRAFLKKINRELGTTIILTTHDLTEIEELCERIVIIDHGKLVYDGSLEQIRSLPGVKRSVIAQCAGSIATAPLQAKLEKASIRVEGSKIFVDFIPQEHATIEVVRTMVETLPIADLSVSEASIEDILIRIYKDGMPPAN